MSNADFLSRRRLLKLTLGTALAPLALVPPRTSRAADQPLLDPRSAEAKAVSYVEDASQAKDAGPGNACATCGLYQGASGSAQGGCQLFPGKQVKAAGWCSSWAPQM
jgi:hypothetical protein